MNRSQLSWRDLTDLVKRTVKSFSIKLVFLSIVFSIISVILQFHFPAHDLTLKILNAKINIVYSDAGKPVDRDVNSVLWNAKPNSCLFIPQSQGFVFFPWDDSCTAHDKIINAIRAGLDGVIFHVPEGTQLALDGHYNIQILESYIDLSIVKNMTPLHLSNNVKHQPVVKFVISEFLTNLVLSYVSGFIVFILGWMSLCIKNYKRHRQLNIVEALIRWCLMLLDIEFSSYAPRLYSVPFQEYKISQGDLEAFGLHNDSLQGETDKLCFNDCCSICLEDFEENNVVRSLPCKHVFHSECIDPWILNHKRLCPVCRSDVITQEKNEHGMEI